MAASVSAWLKPGAWALDAEEHDAALAVGNDLHVSSLAAEPQQHHDFPSLAAAAASKTSKKKKKPQPVSLAEFTSGKPVSHGAGGRALSSAALTPDELLALPTGPRERSAEELERSSSRGFGYSYGSRGRTNGEEANPDRWGASRVSDEPKRGGFGGFNRDLEPSRADEIDDWGAAKKSSVPERRERVGGGRGPLFESHSRADESDSWISAKSAAPPRAGSSGGFIGSRDRMGGFGMLNKEESNGGRADSDTWGTKKDFTPSDAWKKEGDVSNGARRRLVLQPRSLPLSNGDNVKPVQGEKNMVSPEKKSRASNPFGVARPREEVLAEKGQDWKEIDEKLESMKILNAQRESVSVSKKGFGTSNGSTDGENSWRKPLTTESSPRNDKAEKLKTEATTADGL